MNKFNRFRTVCIVFCVIAKYIRINFINSHKLIIFIMMAECVLCKIGTKYLY
jgi:hypothetical protein